MKWLLLVLVVGLGIVRGVQAQTKQFSETDLSQEGQTAFKTLLTAERFESVHVGYGGEFSKYVAAYRVLLADERRTDALTALLEKATIAGQLYALAGLYDVDHTFFRAAVERYKKSDLEVQTLDGCIGSRSGVKDVVFRDEPQTIRLTHPTQPFDEWRRKAKLKPEDGFFIDIAGGGYSLFFRGYDLK